MAEEKKAKKVYTLDEIKFNEENKAISIVSWIPLVGFIMLLVEKKDNFVRYVGAQATVLVLISIALGTLSFIIAFIPVIRVIMVPITWLYSLAVLVCIIVGMVKTAEGERFDIPLVSDLALKLMGVIQV
ncbi:MAG TPA: DUF4870 domain-containing protein [Candidatus Dojkabacteria bacterium]|nr:DUF4870 domain-containing protein [Candidatus Dojkabacteria bacterium]